MTTLAFPFSSNEIVFYFLIGLSSGSKPLNEHVPNIPYVIVPAAV